MKFNKVLNKIVVIIFAILLFTGIGLVLKKYIKYDFKTVVIGNNDSKYNEVQYGEERINGTNFVTFDAYFLTKSKKYRGAYLPYAKSDDSYNVDSKDLWIEIRVFGNGSLKNAKIQFIRDNVNENFTLLESATIAKDVIGNNINEVPLKEVKNGSTVLFRVKITPNLSKFISDGNIVKIVGEHVDNDGVVTQLEKEVKFTVESSVDNAIALNQLHQYYIPQYSELSIPKSDGNIVLNHLFRYNFGNYVREYLKENMLFYRLSLKEGVIESDIEALNGVYPSKVEIESNNILKDDDYILEYDSTNGKLKIRIVKFGKLHPTYNLMKIKVFYPESAMNYDNEHIFKLKTKVYAVVNNNPSYQNPIISNSVEETSNIKYKHTPSPNITPQPKVNSYNGEIYELTKDKVIDMYEGDNPDSDLEEWRVVWTTNIDNNEGNQEVILTSGINGNADYLYSYGIEKKYIDNYVTNKGLRFYYNKELKNNAKIDLYDNDSGVLIHSFNKDEIIKYMKEMYEINPNVKHLKYVINNIDLYNNNYSYSLGVHNYKTINDRMLKNNIDRDTFNRLSRIYSFYNVKTGDININVPLVRYYSESSRTVVSYYNNYYYSMYNNNNTNDNYSVSKIGVTKLYNGSDGTEDLYSSFWVILPGQRRENSLQIISNNGEKISEVYGYDKSTVNENYIKYHGIQFKDSPSRLLGEDGWIKVYNNDNNELIAAFNNENWDNYLTKPFIYENDISNIKVLTSKLNNDTALKIENIMKIEDDKIKNNMGKEDFDKLKFINKHLDYSSKTLSSSTQFSGIGSAEYTVNYYDLRPIVTHKGSIYLSTYKPVRAGFSINLNTIAPKDAKDLKNWKNSIVLMEFPKDIVDLSNISLDSSNARVAGYEVIEKDGKKFLKIYLNSNIGIKEQNLSFSSLITVNPIADNQNTAVKVYVCNQDNDKYLYETNNIYQPHQERDDIKDIHDIDGDGDINEKIGYAEIDTKIVAPQELHINQKIINYNTDGDVVNAPNIGVIDGNGTGKAIVLVQLKNNFPPSVTNVRVLGTIPFKDNKSALSGISLGSKNDTFMNGPLKIPEKFKNSIKVYYTEKEDVDTNWMIDLNYWKTQEQVNNWNKIKHYYIDLGENIINVNELVEFSYEVRVPSNATYNEPTFAINAFSVDLNTVDGRLTTVAEANKVGLKLLKRFNLEIDAGKMGTSSKLQGLIYLAKSQDDNESKTGITNNEGKTSINGLLVDKEYVLEKISDEEDYISNNSSLKFKVIESNGNMILQFIDGQDKIISSEVIQPTVDTSTKVKMNFGYVSKYNITLKKVNVENDNPLRNVRYDLYEGEQINRSYRTDENGNITFKKLVPGIEYSLKEIHADGYYLNEPFKFKVVNTNGNPKINVLSGDGNDLVINKIDKGIDEASVKFTNTKAKRYSIDITKYIKGKNDKLAGASFMISGDDLLYEKIVETDINGHVVIDGLYEYKPGQSYTGEYTIEEISPPDGYTRNTGKLKIKAQRNNSGTLEVSIIEDSLIRNTNSGKDIVLEGADTDNAIYKIGIEDLPLFTIIKTDAKTGKRLAKTKFAIFQVDDDGAENTAYDSKGNIVGNEEEINGKNYRVIETDKNGEYTKDLKPGQYKFIELSTIDDRYEIDSSPKYVGVGEKLKPKYGWTEVNDAYPQETKPEYGVEIERFQGVTQHGVKFVKYNYTWKFSEKAQKWELINKQEVWRTKEYDLKGTTFNKIAWDENVALVKEGMDPNFELVFLDMNDGHEIKRITNLGNYKIISSRLVYDASNRKYILFDDNYNELFRFDDQNHDIFQYSHEFNGESKIRKINDNYYVQFNVEGSYENTMNYYIYKLDSQGNVLKTYTNFSLTRDKFLIKKVNVNSGPEYGMMKFELYDLSEKKISDINVMYGIKFQPYPIIKDNGDIKYSEDIHNGNKYDFNKHYKFGIILPQADPVSEINIQNKWKKFNISGILRSGGGKINEFTEYYKTNKLEEVEIYSDSNKEIKVIPDMGYKISEILINDEKIPLKLNDDGSMILPKFENVTEDKIIKVEFSNTISYVKVNHYKKDTTEKLIESEIIQGNYNNDYATSPASIEGYELVKDQNDNYIKPTNASGKFTTNDIEVNYYYQPKKVDVITSYELENGTKIIQDSIQKVKYGENYLTQPGVVDNKYELDITPENATGKVIADEPIKVRYIYRLKNTKVIVHHYIKDTNDKVPSSNGGVNEDQVIEGKVDDNYNSNASIDIPKNYEVVNNPNNASGVMTVDQIEVTYYYQLKQSSIDNSRFEKISPQIANNVNQKINYSIKYNGSVKDYIGKGALEITDNLPYKIDLDKSDLNGGEYDEQNKTIKWKILINDINSFDNKGDIEIIKTFGIVYKEIPINEHLNIKNSANVKFKLLDLPSGHGVTEVSNNSVETTTDGQFARRIQINKKWEDNSNVNSKRPQSIKYILKNGNNTVSEQIVTGNTTSDVDWSYAFTNIPKYNSNNELINYTIEEEPVLQDGFKFYKKNITGDMNIGFNITNTFKIPTDTINIRVDKHWDDDSNKANKRPNSILLRLKNGADIVEDKTLSLPGNDWTYTFTDIPKYNQFGNEVNYTIEELESNTGDFKFYNKNISGNYKEGFNVINKFKVPNDKINVKVVKHWDDNLNINQKRPQSIKYVLRNIDLIIKEQIVTGNVNNDDNWTYIFNDIPKYNELGNIINYQVEENEVTEGDFKFYSNKIVGDMNTGFTLTNKFVVPTDKVEINVIKHWEDNSNINDRRPESIKFVIKNNNNEIKSKVVKGNKNSDEGWNYTFNNLEKYDENGQEINYVLEEQEVYSNDMKFYSATVRGNHSLGFVVTNKFVVPNEVIKPRVTIDWNDNSNENHKRPNEVDVIIKDNNGNIVKKDTMTGDPNDNQWGKELDGVPKYDENGKEIPYTVEIVPKNPNDLEFYVPAIKGDKDNGFIVTENFVIPGKTIDFEVIKKWDDNNNQRNKRPDSIKLIIKNGDNIISDRIISGDKNSEIWNYTFNGLPKYDVNNGNEIIYTVDEQEVNTGDLLFYSKMINNNVITNTMRLTGDGDISESKIEKTSTLDKITEANQEIPYKISYSGKIDNYIGRAKITITDKLPFEIDLTKSNIGDGVYDGVNKTITFIENISGIDTYNNGSKLINFERNIKIVYKNLKVTPNAKNVNNGVSADIELTDTTKKVEENGGKEIPTDITSRIIVKYIVPGDNNDGKVAEDKIIEGKIGDEYHITPPDNVDDNYELVKVDGEIDGVITQEEKTVNYIYRKKNGRIIVRYIDKDSNKKLYDDDVIEGKIGEKANIKAKEVAYYNLAEEPKNIEIKSEEQTITYAYKKKIFNMEVDKLVKDGSIDNQPIHFSNNKFTKLDIPVKKVNNSKVKIKYSIKVRNTGEIKGSAIVAENVPEFFEMLPEENPDWTFENGKILSREVELNPNEEKELFAVITWKNGRDNFGNIINSVKIDKTKNDAGFDETDSEEEKKNKHNRATVILAVKTGNDDAYIILKNGISAVLLLGLITLVGLKLINRIKDY